MIWTSCKSFNRAFVVFVLIVTYNYYIVIVCTIRDSSIEITSYYILSVHLNVLLE